MNNRERNAWLIDFFLPMIACCVALVVFAFVIYAYQ
jgi:hypothetical protein